MRKRRAALEGLGRILDVGGLEELFAGPDDEAAYLYDLLAEAARGRSSGVYWEICRTARRRGVTPEYVADRAAVLRGAIDERRRTDLYRILGAAPLSSPEMLRQRWLEFAKENHPDVGGDPATFRHVKEAYDILRDPDRRADYERFWVRALAPFERVAPPEEAPPRARRLPPATPLPEAPARALQVPVARKPAALERFEPRPGNGGAAANGANGSKGTNGGRPGATGLLPERALVDRGMGPLVAGEIAGVSSLVSRLEAMLAPVSTDQIHHLQAEIAAAMARLEGFNADLARLKSLKLALPA